ncbi:hypothetical protein [Mannheimia pernigra]|uniref:Uncharacterized protein n=1 Tax=Mannheimia pernigra TaxID=111844 RepID=A0A7D5HRH2_9PAST|nr:hypothetical protein [Mannheimia pernigra]QLB41174.1 hypothetical protein HV559_10030 [Mannheimia pernigra]
MDEELSKKYFATSIREISLIVTGNNIEKTKKLANLSSYEIKIYNSTGEIGSVNLRYPVPKDGKIDDGLVMKDFANNLLRSGMEESLKGNENNIFSMSTFLNEFIKDETRFSISNLQDGNQAKFNDVNLAYSKFTSLVMLRNEIKTQDENDPKAGVINNTITIMIDKIYEAIKKDINPDVNREALEKSLENLKADELERFSVYGFYNNVYLPSVNKENKIAPKQETEQEMLDRLVKEGMSLGEIKEKYPQLDRLVAKEHEAFALGNVNEQTKEVEIKEENIGIRV